MTDDIAAIGRDPAWLPHQIDLRRGAATFVHLDRDDHARLTFLTDEYIPKNAPRRPMPLGALAGAAHHAPAGSCRFILHSAFCCSTLLARAFDLPGVSMGYKEPVALMNLATAAIEGADVRTPLAATLGLLARPFAPGEVAVIKPTNIVNPIAEAMLTARPEATALLLYAPLRVFLRSVAAKGLFGRVWARRSAALIQRRPEFDPGYSPQERWEQTDLQVAALGWLHQQAQFARLVRTLPARVATLDSDTLLADPATALAAIARLFGLDAPKDRLAAITAGPIFTRDAKSHDKAFDAVARSERHRAAERAYGEEIDMVVRWAEAVAAHVRAAMTPGGALIG